MVKIVGWSRSTPVTTSGAVIASVTENPDSPAISGSTCATVAANTGSSPAAQRPSAPTANPARRTPTPDPDRRGRPRLDTEVSPSATSRRAVVELLGRLLGDDRRAHRTVPTPARQGVAEIRQRHVVMRCHPVGQPAGGAAQFVGRGGRQRKKQWCSSSTIRRDIRGRCGFGSLFGCLFHDGVDVGSRQSVRRHRRAPGRSPFVGHGVVSCGTKSFVSMRATSSGSRVKCRFCGTTPCCSARIAFISPRAPEAD